VKLRDSKGALPYEYRDHALFVAFAPYEKPEVAVAVVIEHGEHGGSAAAPIAGRMLRAYFEGKGVIKKTGSSKADNGADAGEKSSSPDSTDSDTPQKREAVPGNGGSGYDR
jgi:penicillin-binding protein 2